MPLPIVATIGAFLARAAGPIAKRVLVAIGIGTVTYQGLDVAFEAVKQNIISNYGQMSGNVADLVNLAGVGQAIGIILGALAARVALAAMSHLGKVL